MIIGICRVEEDLLKPEADMKFMRVGGTMNNQHFFAGMFFVFFFWLVKSWPPSSKVVSLHLIIFDPRPVKEH